jgi:hypothetical protein
MKKSVLFSLLVLTSFSASASETLENCQVIKMIDESVLEESLSIDEYPEVSIEKDEFGSYVMKIGANTFENDREFRVEPIIVVHSTLSFGYETVNIANDEAYIVRGGLEVGGGSPKRLGTVSYRSGGETKVLAEIACNWF